MACDQKRLDAAREAYHDLMTGRLARVVVDSNGERVEFTAANATRLQAYIQQLEIECRGVGLNHGRTRGPFGFTF